MLKYTHKWLYKGYASICMRVCVFALILYATHFVGNAHLPNEISAYNVLIFIKLNIKVCGIKKTKLKKK